MLSFKKQMMNALKYYKTPILMLFSFLFGGMLTINLIPIDKTCRIEDTDHEYNIMQNSKLRNPELIILIMSAPKNLHLRNAIRQTWLKFIDTNPYNKQTIKMKHYFVIGSLSLSADDILHISSEQSQFSDILILPMYDHYQNLSEKVLKSFEWLNEQFNYGLGFKYVLKCDDDSFVRLDKLATEIANMELIYLKSKLSHVKQLAEHDESPFIRINVQVNDYTQRNELQLYWGYFRGDATVKKVGKWKETQWILSDKYIPYAQGGGYILSKGLVSYLAKNANTLRQFNSEDVSMGLWLAPVTNVLRVHDIRFDTEWTSRGCQSFYLITHKISEKEMQQLYSNVVQTNRLCKTETVKREYFLYNWTIPPSQCCSKR